MPHKEKDGSWVLDEEDLVLVAYIEEQFWLHNITPPVGNIAEALEYDGKRVIELLHDEQINNYLRSRAVPNPLVEPVETKGLTAQQILVANMVLNSMDKKSMREKLKTVGVSSQTYYAWMNNPNFANYIQARSERMFTQSEWQIRQALVETAADGDVSAIKLYMEMIGKYVPRMEHSVNLEGLLSQVVEIVSYFLEKEQMLEFANMVEILLQTGTIPKREAITVGSRELSGAEN
jgi:hypothetical protein